MKPTLIQHSPTTSPAGWVLLHSSHYKYYWILSPPLGCKLHEGRDQVFLVHSLTRATLIIGTWSFVKFYRLSLELFLNLLCSSYLYSLYLITDFSLYHQSQPTDTCWAPTSQPSEAWQQSRRYADRSPWSASAPMEYEPKRRSDSLGGQEKLPGWGALGMGP